MCWEKQYAPTSNPIGKKLGDFHLYINGYRHRPKHRVYYSAVQSLAV